MTIAIIAAMQPELAALKKHLQQPQKQSIHGFDFYTGHIRQQKVVLVQSGIGKVAATLATSLVIDKFQPSYVINTGSAGGLDPAMQVGDVVIADSLAHHDVDVTPFGFTYGQVFDMPETYASSAKLIEQAKTALEQQSINACIGQVVTGDSFLYQADKVSFVQQQFPLAKAVEMEGAAIAQTCYLMRVPMVVIRALSDIAGQSSHMSFEQFLPLASERSAAMVLAMLELD